VHLGAAGGGDVGAFGGDALGKAGGPSALRDLAAGGLVFLDFVHDFVEGGDDGFAGGGVGHFVAGLAEHEGGEEGVDVGAEFALDAGAVDGGDGEGFFVGFFDLGGDEGDALADVFGVRAGGGGGARAEEGEDGDAGIADVGLASCGGLGVAHLGGFFALGPAAVGILLGDEPFEAIGDVL
jgi:hypothetical protein